MAMGMATQSLRGTFTTDGIVTNDPVGIIIHPQLAKSADGNTYTQYVVKLQAASATVKGLCVAEKVTMFGQTLTLIINSDDQEIQVDGVWATLHYGEHFAQRDRHPPAEPECGRRGCRRRITGRRPGEFGISAGGAQLGPSHGTLQAAMIKSATLGESSGTSRSWGRQLLALSVSAHPWSSSVSPV